MAFNSIPQAWIESGKFTIQSLWQYIKDNFDALYSSIFGISNSDVPNGSFGIDSDSDGVADSWTVNLYPGGSSELDSTDRTSGLKCLKFVHPGGAGNGGGYYVSDYVPCSVLRPANLRFAHKASAAGMHNQVILLWYTAAMAYISSTTIYNDSATNQSSWTQYIRGAVPVATACFFKVQLVGGDSDDATGGTARFDDVGLVGGIDSVVGYAENAGTVNDAADRIHIATVLSSPVIGVSSAGFYSNSGVKKNVAGGGDVVVDLLLGAVSKLTVTLALPAGLWTVWASAHYQNGDAASVTFEGNLTAMAIREG